MDAKDFGAVSTTVATRDDAERIAEVLLSERLAACVQISPIDSRYVWKGTLTREPEFRLTIKTRVRLFRPLIARVAALHPYAVPEILAAPFADAHEPYLRWIAENTTD